VKRNPFFQFLIFILIGSLLLLSLFPHVHSWEGSALPWFFSLIILFVLLTVVLSSSTVLIQLQPHTIANLRAPPN
jgi:hypothetical protein